jgi:hypothetical protein
MEGALAKQVRYGRSCQKCKAYFVTDREELHLCPWCEKIESGQSPAEAYEFDSQKDWTSGYTLAG